MAELSALHLGQIIIDYPKLMWVKIRVIYKVVIFNPDSLHVSEQVKNIHLEIEPLKQNITAKPNRKSKYNY